MYTLNTTEVHQVAYPVENHPNDSRVKICEDGVVQTLSSRMGTGGGNTPMVLEPKTFSLDRRQQSVDEELMNTLTTVGGGDNYPTVFIRATQQGNAETYEDLCPTITAMAGMSGNNQPVAFIPKSYGVVSKGNGEAWLTEEKHMSLSVGGGQAGQGYPCVAEPKAFNMDSLSSNSMKSNNPHSGFHETKVSKCLDASGPDPCKNQGGTLILQPIAVDCYNSKEDGDKTMTLRSLTGGYEEHMPCVVFGVDAYNQQTTGDKAKTLNASASDSDHVPCVCMETLHCVPFDEVCPTLKRRDYKDPPCVFIGEENE